MQALLEAGAKEATGALARLVGDPPPPVTIGLVQRRSPAEVIAAVPKGELVGVGFGVGGAVDGALLMLCERQEALRLVARLMVGHAGKQVDAHARSALSEVGNILASAFLNQIANALGSSVLPTPPLVAVGQAQPVIDELMAAAAQPETAEWVLIRADLDLDGWRFAFDLVVVPASESFARLQ